MLLKEDPQGVRFTLREVCRDECILAVLSLNHTLDHISACIVEAKAFWAQLMSDCEETQYDHIHEAPGYAKRIFEGRVPDQLPELQKIIITVLSRLSLITRTAGIDQMPHAAPLSDSRVDVYRLTNDLKEFEAFE